VKEAEGKVKKCEQEGKVKKCEQEVKIAEASAELLIHKKGTPLYDAAVNKLAAAQRELTKLRGADESTAKRARVEGKDFFAIFSVFLCFRLLQFGFVFVIFVSLVIDRFLMFFSRNPQYFL
jgi:hypothetical protein